MSLDNATRSIPSVAETIDGILGGSPLALFGKHLDSPKLQAFLVFQRAVTSFREAAGRLDFTLGQAVRQFNAGQGIHASNDGSRLSFCLGRIHELQPEILLQWIGGGIPATALVPLQACSDAVLANSNVQATVPLYLAARQAVQAALQHLRAEIQKPV